jgi:anti-sigma factor RsiW
MNERTRRLNAYLDGELTASEADALRRELAHDARLRDELDALRRLWHAVESTPEPRLAGALWPDLSDRLAAAHGPRSHWTWPQRGLAAAALAAGVVLGFGLGEQATSPQVAMVGDEPGAEAGAATGSDAGADYLQQELTTLDQLWFELGETAEDVDS